ncbi:MAG: MoxR family ATPase [Leptolinea sp.]|jgi:MoxR-like ATPase|nr:MoxR family ATPase [Leptolinea sp.]
MSNDNELRHAQELGTRILGNLEKVIFGKRSVLELVITGLFSGGHILVEDVPGVGKTILARSLAISTGCTFARIQFTPDLLPGDITGVSVFDQKKNTFEFRPGPVFTQILLADEINRATPKAQSALLEAMGENQVSVDNVTRELPRPFFVIATQNPIEYEGVYPLPESQMDRFLLHTGIGYPEMAVEESILERMQVEHPIETLKPVATSEEILRAQTAIRSVFVSHSVRMYLLGIIQATRNHNDLLLGASPRASLGLIRAAQASAALQGRNFVAPDDIKLLAGSVLTHRLILSPEARMSNISGSMVIHEILDNVRAPLRDETVKH